MLLTFLRAVAMDNHVLALNLERPWTSPRAPPTTTARIVRYSALKVYHVAKTILRYLCGCADPEGEAGTGTVAQTVEQYKDELRRTFVRSEQLVIVIMNEVTQWLDG